MDIMMRLKAASAREIERELPRPPSYSAVRSILRVLVNKNLLLKKKDSDRDVFSLASPASSVRRGFLKSFVRNFFADSAAEAACALLGQKNVTISDGEAKRLLKLIEEARRK